MTAPRHEKKWWKEAVVYQIYPASFYDSNGDGIGDVPGITAKLDYLATLGVDVIWVCPTYDSPQVDMGYDISNYEDIYPAYGTLQDMETLIQETHARGMRILVDLVINHTSDQHAWFKESRQSKDNRKRDWYIWRPARISPEGERLPPNNWRAAFGEGSAWEWDDQTEEYYLHIFAAEQPDLNWENEETRKAVYASAMTFWLERGVDGFRVDTVNLYSKPPGLPDAPIVDPTNYYQPGGPFVCNGPRVHEFIGEMHQILEKYGAITVGELGGTPDTQRVLAYVGSNAKQLDMVFQFDVVDVGIGQPDRFDTVPRNFKLTEFKEAVERTQKLVTETDGWTTVYLENHDQGRSVSRFANDSPNFRGQSAKMLCLMEICLSGTLYIYQGQEIGLVNAPKDTYPLENYLDIWSTMFVESMKQRHGDNDAAREKALTALQYFARDHARIPVPWSPSFLFGGFSEMAETAGKEVKKPWMKTHPLAGEINVASQLDDEKSVLGFWRTMLRFRQEYADLLVYGTFEQLQRDDEGVFVFVKESPNSGDKALVVLNFSEEKRSWKMPCASELGRSLAPLVSTCEGTPGADALEPFEGRVYIGEW